MIKEFLECFSKMAKTITNTLTVNFFKPLIFKF